MNNGDVVVFRIPSWPRSLHGVVTNINLIDSQYVLTEHDEANLYVKWTDVLCNVSQTIDKLSVL